MLVRSIFHWLYIVIAIRMSSSIDTESIENFLSHVETKLNSKKIKEYSSQNIDHMFKKILHPNHNIKCANDPNIKVTKTNQINGVNISNRRKKNLVPIKSLPIKTLLTSTNIQPITHSIISDKANANPSDSIFKKTSNANPSDSIFKKTSNANPSDSIFKKTSNTNIDPIQSKELHQDINLSIFNQSNTTTLKDTTSQRDENDLMTLLGLTKDMQYDDLTIRNIMPNMQNVNQVG
jgi:hypothetical protein